LITANDETFTTACSKHAVNIIVSICMAHHLRITLVMRWVRWYLANSNVFSRRLKAAL